MTPSRFETSDEPMFVNILSNNDLHEMMKDFARSECSAENIRIWDCIQLYRSSRDYEERMQIAHYIYNTFLSIDAPRPVNIKEIHKEKAWEQIETRRMVGNLFDNIEEAVRECLEDICTRFLRTKEYLEYIELAKQRKEEQLKRESLDSDVKSV
ncbi:regulator of G-protein signaling [Acrasis kona]